MADKKVRVVPLVNRLLRVGIITEAKIHASVDLSREDWKKVIADTADAIDAHDFEQERVAADKAEVADAAKAKHLDDAKFLKKHGHKPGAKSPVVIGAKKTASSPTNLLRDKPPADYMDRYNAAVRGKSDAPFPPAEDVIVPPAPENPNTPDPAKGEVPPPAVGASGATAKPAGDVVVPPAKDEKATKHAHAPKPAKGTK